MILALEILLTIGGLYLLITGKSWDKKSRATQANWRFRLLGGFMLTVWIAMFFCAIVVDVIYAIQHPNAAPAAFQQDLHWVFIGIEVGLVLLYALITHFWHKAIVNRLAQMQAPPTTDFGGSPIPPAMEYTPPQV
jgi:hypothetical protein